MTLAEAKALLDTCKRGEFRDYAFGDTEATWSKDGKQIASAYFGRESSVTFHNEDVLDDNGCYTLVAEFEGSEARALRYAGTLDGWERNDSLGNYPNL